MSARRTQTMPLEGWSTRGCTRRDGGARSDATMGVDVLPATLRTALERAVGPRNLLVDPELTATYETDWTRRFSGRAAAVARPATSAEVTAVLRACDEAGQGVVPQGGDPG